MLPSESAVGSFDCCREPSVSCKFQAARPPGAESYLGAVAHGPTPQASTKTRTPETFLAECILTRPSRFVFCVYFYANLLEATVSTAASPMKARRFTSAETTKREREHISDTLRCTRASQISSTPHLSALQPETAAGKELHKDLCTPIRSVRP